MRIKAAVIILVAVGVVFAANLLVDDARITPLQLGELRTACPTCHSLVPEYDTVITVHNLHAALSCSRCHNYVNGLMATDKAHAGLQWLGFGAMLLGLMVIVANILVVNRRIEAK